MARAITMPPERELPRGPRRDFVEELRRYYRGAGRPSLRKVSRAIEGRKDLHEVTASPETIRRIIKGIVIPTEQDRVYALFRAFCEMAGTDPDGERWDDDYGNNPETNWQCLRRLWDTALEEGPVGRSGPAQSPGPDSQEDWEPPF